MYIIDLCFLLPIFAAKRGWGFFIINQKSVINNHKNGTYMQEKVAQKSRNARRLVFKISNYHD